MFGVEDGIQDISERAVVALEEIGKSSASQKGKEARETPDCSRHPLRSVKTPLIMQINQTSRLVGHKRALVGPHDHGHLFYFDFGRDVLCI